LTDVLFVEFGSNATVHTLRQGHDHRGWRDRDVLAALGTAAQDGARDRTTQLGLVEVHARFVDIGLSARNLCVAFFE